MLEQIQTFLQEMPLLAELIRSERKIYKDLAPNGASKSIRGESLRDAVTMRRKSAVARKCSFWRWKLFHFLFAGLALLVDSARAAASQLETYATFGDQQVTGVTVSKSGRVFVCFPYWSDNHAMAVAEVGENGKSLPYPSEHWNALDGAPNSHFICVQSVFVDPEDNLWVLDPASIKQKGVTPGGAKLVKIDLRKNDVVDTILFDGSIAPEKSYLNDVRIDPGKHFAFITDSGLGAIVVVDLNTRKARRVLTDSPSTKAEPDLLLKIQGVPLINETTGKPVQVNSDGIALDPANGRLYFQALTGHTLYRIKISDLEDDTLDEKALGERVERFASVPAADGLAFRGDAIFFTAIEEDAIVRIDLRTRETTTVVKDEVLRWPDTLSFDPRGVLFITCSQIHLTPRFNHGLNRVVPPFTLYQIVVPGQKGD
jgi:sugar lactone lactonase YvrE